MRCRETADPSFLPTRAPRGFTLVELLIAMTLGLFLVAAVLSVFLGGLNTFRATDSLSRIQENGRIAMEIMRRDIRQAGFWGCRQTLFTEPDPTAEGALNGNMIRNTLNSTSWDFNFGAAVEGYTWTGAGWSNLADGSGTALDPAGLELLDPAPRTDSDIVAISRAQGSGVIVTAHPGGNPPGSANIQIDPGSGIEQFDILMVTDCSSAAIFQVSSANPNTSGSIAHNTGLGVPGNRTQALGRDFRGAQIYQMTKSAFYVANSPETGRPGLFHNGEELAENVERLRATFGVDGDTDRRIDDYVTADLVTDWSQVRSVRMELLFSSGPDGNLLEQPASFTFNDGTTFDAPDLRAYQMFTMTVGIRNRLP